MQEGTRNNTKILSKNISSIFTNQSSRIKTDRSKMDVDAKASSKQIYIENECDIGKAVTNGLEKKKKTGRKQK